MMHLTPHRMANPTGSIGANAIERRREMRMVADVGAAIIAGSMELTCRLVDLSLSGACLEFNQSYELPEEFDLILEGCPKVPCRAVWCDQNRVGVAFQEDRDCVCRPGAPRPTQ